MRYDHSVLARVVNLGRLRGGDCDLDRVVSRTVAYAIVTALLAGIYSGLVLLATQVLRFYSPVAIAAATLAAAALFSPPPGWRSSAVARPSSASVPPGPGPRSSR